MQKIIDGLAAFAGLMGAGGVAAAAASAHLPGAARLTSVAMILLVHAVAVLQFSARARDCGKSSDCGNNSRALARVWLTSALVLALGAALFSCDVALLTLRGARLFPMAAPTGGVAMILGWLIASGAGLAGLARGYR